MSQIILILAPVGKDADVAVSVLRNAGVVSQPCQSVSELCQRLGVDYPFMLDISIVTLLFAMIFKFLPDARLSWRDVRLGAALTAALFLVGKYALGHFGLR